MAKTCNSAANPYATPADFILFIDVNVPGLLSRDDGGQNSATQLQTDPYLAAALAVASGEVEAAMMVSKRYSTDDLQALTGNALWLLKSLVCGLAIQHMRWRRAQLEQALMPIADHALKTLQALHDGKEIFAFEETEQAGLPSIFQMMPADFFVNLPTLLTNQTRYWGYRANRGRQLGDGGFFGGGGGWGFW
jgi:hypothetical protein